MSATMVLVRVLLVCVVVASAGLADAGCTVGPIKCYADAVNARVLGQNVNDRSTLTQELVSEALFEPRLTLSGPNPPCHPRHVGLGR